MARYLFTLWSFPGHINASLGLAVALRERGHDVAFYTGARASATLAGLGIDCLPMRGVDEEALYRRMFPADDSAGSSASIAELRRLRNTLWDWLVGTLPGQLADLTPIVEQWRPDVIVCDTSLWAPIVVLHEARGIPVAGFSSLLACQCSGRDVPPWGPGLPLPTTPLRRARVTLHKALIQGATRRFREAVSALRAEYGLPPISMSVIDFSATLPLHLIAGIRELDYNRQDLPAAVHYLGWCDWARPSADEVPEWIAELPAEKPLVYVTEGTLQGGRPRLLTAAAHGLANLPIQVLLKNAQIVRQDRDLAHIGLGSLAPNMRVEGYIAGQGWQRSVLERTSIFITNGGASSVMAALSAGVPLIVVPTAWDKPENAQRVVEAGVGLRLSPRRCTPRRLREAVEQVLGDPSFRANATAMAEALGRYTGPARGADLLDALYESSSATGGGDQYAVASGRRDGIG